MSDKKKIIVMTDWFAPGYKAGGPIQSCVNFCLAMKEEYDIYVITTDTDLDEEHPYENILSDQWISSLAPAIPTYYFSATNLTNSRLRSVINDVTPDYIYLNHVFSFRFVIMPLLLNRLGMITTQIVICPRGALYDSAIHYKNKYLKKILTLGALKWMGVFKKVCFHATNEREKGAITKYFKSSKIVVANNLPAAPEGHLTSIEKERGVLKLIYVARILPIKNLIFILRLLIKVKGNIVFTLIGPIEDAEYWNECKKVIDQLPTHIQVAYMGAKANNELLSIIKQHHLYTLPTTGENFGHSIFESLLMGRPVLISDQTPWRQLEDKQIGWDLPLGDSQAFVSAIEEVVNWNQSEFDLASQNAWRFAKEFTAQSLDLSGYKKMFL